MSKSFQTLFADGKQTECLNCVKIAKEFELLRRDHLDNQELLNSAQKSKAAIETDLKNAELELKKNRQKCQQLQSELDAINEKFSKMSGELERNNSTVNQMKEINSKLREQKEELLFTKPVEVVSENSQEVNRLGQELRHAQKEKEHALSVNTKLSLELQQLKIELSRLRNVKPIEVKPQEDNYAKIENDNLKQRISSLMEQLEANQNEQRKQTQQYQQQLQKYEEQLNAVDNQMDQSQSYQVQMKKLQTQIKQLEAHIKALQHQIEFKDKKIKEQAEDKEQIMMSVQQTLSNQISMKSQNDSDDDNSNYKYKVKYQELKQQSKQQHEQLEQRINHFERYSRNLESMMKSSIYIYYKEQGGLDMIQNTKLIMENQDLKKRMQEYQAIYESGNKKQEQQDEYLQLKLTITNQKKQIDDLSARCTKTQSDTINLKKQLETTQDQLVMSKFKIGELMNAALDFGGTKLVDKFTQHIS